MRPRDRKEKPPVVIPNRINFNKRKQEEERDAAQKLEDMDPSVCSPPVSLVIESPLRRHIIQVGPGLRGVPGHRTFGATAGKHPVQDTTEGRTPPAHVLTAGGRAQVTCANSGSHPFKGAKSGPYSLSSFLSPASWLWGSGAGFH